MNQKSLVSTVLILLAVGIVHAQIPLNVHVQIVKAEDARDASSVIALLEDANPKIRIRAALAAGRIGDDKAIEALSKLMNDKSLEVRAIAVFAIGEIESEKGSGAILSPDGVEISGAPVMARRVEAAGKIAAANPRGSLTSALQTFIFERLSLQAAMDTNRDRLTTLLALTAALRARPPAVDVVVAKFLGDADARVRADALNTLSRLRSKQGLPDIRHLLKNETDAVVRAAAARTLGSAEDKVAFDILLDAATKDLDQRVRVSAIRSLATLNDVKAAEKLLEHGERLLGTYKSARKPNYIPAEQTEFLELATAMGRIFQGSGNERAVEQLESFRELNGFVSGDVESGLARISPGRYIMAANLTIEGEGYVYPADSKKKRYANWKVLSALATGIGAVADLNIGNPNTKDLAISWLKGILETAADPRYDSDSFARALPDVYRALARFKTADMAEIARVALQNRDLQTRAAAAAILADLSASSDNVEALKKAFALSYVVDKKSDDAQLGIMAALFRLNKREAVGILLNALESPNYLVRQRAFRMLADADLQKGFPGIASSLESAKAKGNDRVKAYSPINGTFLGQVISGDADYRRALSRKNGSVKAVFTMQKGTFTIDFNPEEAPLTVDSFVNLARRGYFNGAEVHRVVANFVMQDGDPTGTGSGGPGLSIRCEVNMLEYERGSVGMALSGKDTGGSQWFVTHSPQPHLDGGYTLFGRVNETGMKVVDNIVRGDKIIRVRIIGR